MKIWIDGQPTETDAAQGSLYAALLRMGKPINAPCGGNGRCGKCRVRIKNATAPTAQDMRLLSADEITAGVRLACATSLFEGMDVWLEQPAGTANIATSGLSVSYPFAPPVALKHVNLSAPSLEDQRGDLERLSAAVGCELKASPAVLAGLPAALRASGWSADVVVMGDRLLGYQPKRLLGVAVDIGTTTLAAYLLDIATGAELAVASAMNPQRPFGDDVITRADYARAGGLEELQQAVVREINRLTGEMCEKAGVAPDDIFHLSFAGNTVMLHLLAGVTPENIAQAPFIPAWTGALECPASSLGLTANTEAVATILPCVAGYVGGDTVAALLAAGVREGVETALLIDIGTNGEIALSAGGAVYACSTAAGPAFEGAHISAGMGGVSGAINKVAVDGGIRYETIGGEPAKGICGSGLLDLIAGFLDCGAIDETGRIDEDAAPEWVRFVDGKLAVDEAAGIFLTKRDIREVQLAKGAIAAGVDVLLNLAGISAGDVRHVYLAGGFGSFMDRRSACRIGLIPPELLDRTEAIGNGSGAGAKAVLLSAAAMQEAVRLSKSVRYVELSARQDFQDAFMDKMMF